MAPFVYATNEEMKINITRGWFLWRLLKSSQIALVQAFQANVVFIPGLGNQGFNWWIWCMYFQQIIYVSGVHLQYKAGGLLECFSPVWRPDWKAEDNRWWNPFFRAGDAKRTVRSVTCLRVGWAELSVRVCTHRFSRILDLCLWWTLFAHLFHFRQNKSWCLWSFFFRGR